MLVRTCSLSVPCYTRCGRDNCPLVAIRPGSIFRAILERPPVPPVRSIPRFRRKLDEIISQDTGEGPQSALPARFGHAAPTCNG